MPICSVAPSGIMPATLRAMARCRSVISPALYSGSGWEVSMNACTRLTCRNVSPMVRGMRSLISTITYLAQRAAVSEQSMLGPRLM